MEKFWSKNQPNFSPKFKDLTEFLFSEISQSSESCRSKNIKNLSKLPKYKLYPLTFSTTFISTKFQVQFKMWEEFLFEVRRISDTKLNISFSLNLPSSEPNNSKSAENLIKLPKQEMYLLVSSTKFHSTDFHLLLKI